MGTQTPVRKRETQILKRTQNIFTKVFIEVINHTIHDALFISTESFQRWKPWPTAGETFSDNDGGHNST